MFWCSIQKVLTYPNVLKGTLYVFLYKFQWSLIHFEFIVFYNVKESEFILLVDIQFCQHYLLNRLFPSVYFFPLSKFTRHGVFILILGPLFYSIGISASFLCKYQIIFITIALQYNLACDLLWVHINSYIYKSIKYDIKF